MKRNKFFIIIAAALLITSCDLLDRPQLNLPDDDTFWTSEANLRLFAQEFYTQFFPGYNSGWGVDYTPVRGNTFTDDMLQTGTQLNFDLRAPDARGSSSNTNSPPAWLSNAGGPTWYFAWIRKANIMSNRIETRMGDVLNEEQYNHWLAVARFFHALEYCRLVSVFGDVPYFEKEITDTETMYKDRTPRNEIMDEVYKEFRFVLANMRVNDGAQRLNRDVAAGFISRWMLFEGTWQKYHNNNEERARKFLNFSVEAAEMLMNSGRYRIHGPFRELFGSFNLAGHPEMILFRSYNSAAAITHHIAAYNNTVESQALAANMSLVRSFIVNDGDVWQNSGVANADQFDLQNLIKTRDPRFEATFFEELIGGAAGLLYTVKFIDRIAPGLARGSSERLPGATYPQYTSMTNTNDAPVVRYGEILLNWIEAKAELATLGVGSVSQADIDRSINALRARPLDATAIANGAQLTAPMLLSALPDDPARIAPLEGANTVEPLIWEIRRERRMELYQELPRILDLKRWRRIQYMRGSANPDILRGIWVDIPNEMPAGFLVPPAPGVNPRRVQKADGSIVAYDGTNAADMVGYFLPANIQDREAFTDRVYLSPIGLDQINLYRSQGFTLTQTPGWQ